MTRIRATLVGLTLVLAVAACGGSKNEEVPLPTSPSDPSTTSVPAAGATPTTTAAPAETGRSCAAILSDGVTLATDWRNAQRGVAGPPDESEYRARAQELLDEARSRGCPVPAAVERFLEYETDGSVE